MISVPEPGFAPASRPEKIKQVWFLDTSALVTLAVHPPLQHAVQVILSQHRRVLVLHLMIRQNKLAAAKAAEFAVALFSAGRAQDYTMDELETGALGRVGKP